MSINVFFDLSSIDLAENLISEGEKKNNKRFGERRGRELLEGCSIISIFYISFPAFQVISG